MSDVFLELYECYRNKHHQRQLAYAEAIIANRRKWLDTDSYEDLRLNMATLHGAFMMADTADAIHLLAEFRAECEKRMQELSIGS